MEGITPAIQRIGYGKHRYWVPKPPFHWSHIYHFHEYTLDCFLVLFDTTKRELLLAIMQGHILQDDILIGHYR